MPLYTIANPTRAPRTIILAGAGYAIAPGATSQPLELPDNIAADERAAGMAVEAVGEAKAAPEPEAVEPDDLSEPKAEGDKFDAMTDEELRDFVEDATGDRPHHRAGREKLLTLARAV